MVKRRRPSKCDLEQASSDRSAAWLVVDASDVAALHQPQDRWSGVNAIIGKWPGDEDDDTVDAALAELS